ncbi:hypothetical protein PAXRUDRAFT_21416 [Paxillus rubicundulus Ve08.2h10]|uniref:Unplaced genomic scaffold scaffold_5457, whole genome shotgun sequence n=1 Tax=Paxillus rubicundulus Ve08.2h10 TaxID=930991 RepID=A0A0D0CBV6_9AGAM|nr:hypothetical protein PAXRUDRAFT_21416 [Paxillus rubicundulus Ve08.2h10]
MARHVRFQTPIGGWPKTISHNTSQATVCSDNNSTPITSTSTLASILLVAIAIDINMSPPNRQFRADPAMQINVNMSPPSRSAVPTLPSPHIIDLEASPPRRSTYLLHANDLADAAIIDPFFCPPPHHRPPQGIRLDTSPPSRGSGLPDRLMPHTGIDLDASPPHHTPLCLPGVAASQPRPTLGSATQSLLQIMHQPTLSPSLTKPSGPWPVALRAQSLAQLIARA